MACPCPDHKHPQPRASPRRPPKRTSPTPRWWRSRPPIAANHTANRTKPEKSCSSTRALSLIDELGKPRHLRIAAIPVPLASGQGDVSCRPHEAIASDETQKRRPAHPWLLDRHENAEAPLTGRAVPETSVAAPTSSLHGSPLPVRADSGQGAAARLELAGWTRARRASGYALRSSLRAQPLIPPPGLFC
jgi:hypothetical protein